MKKQNKARWIRTTINNHAGRALVFNKRGEPGFHVLAQVWPADEKATRWWVSLFNADAHTTASSLRQAQSWARRALLNIRKNLEALAV
jgi:hypothetical protein